MMHVYDISWPIMPTMTAYKDKQVVQIVASKTFAEHGARESLITLSSHTGTHIDAPAHFLQHGMTIDEQGPTVATGVAHVVDMMHVDMIDAAALASVELHKHTIILFKTKNSLKDSCAPFDTQFVYITADAAQMLVDADVQAVGIDYLGIERNQQDHATHRLLLQQGIAIIEGLRLHHVPAGTYFLCCLPLNIVGCDGAPARAILFQQSL